MFSHGQLEVMETASFTQSCYKAGSLETLLFSDCCLFN